MIVTRYNPTLNGPMHLGHTTTLLMNEQFAKDGEFWIRFDDTSPPAANLPKAVRESIMHGQIDDINWLGVKYKGMSIQSELNDAIYKELYRVGHHDMFDNSHPYLPINIRLGMTFMHYPYVPQQIAERVVMDKIMGVTHLIRGEDFTTEYSLYCYFCEIFGYHTPEFIFLPRLKCPRGDISKTNGGYTLKELRGKGYSSEDVRSLLAKACLYYPDNGWDIHNLKPEPRIDL